MEAACEKHRGVEGRSEYGKLEGGSLSFFRGWNGGERGWFQSSRSPFSGLGWAQQAAGPGTHCFVILASWKVTKIRSRRFSRTRLSSALNSSVSCSSSSL